MRVAIKPRPDASPLYEDPSFPNHGGTVTTRRIRFAAALATLAIVAAACGSDDDDAAPQQRSTVADVGGASTTTMAEMMDLPESAAAMTTEITSPAAGTVITENEITFEVKAAGFELACDLAGKPLADGFGHYHVLLDQSLIDMKCTTEASVSLQNVEPGQHTIAVVPAINDHAEVLENEQELEFDYQPASPLATIVDDPDAATPTVEIVSPAPGEVVSGDFDVVIRTTNWQNSCDLYGKPGVAGYGHWHMNFDTTTGPMMGMMTMAGMSCEETFHASTRGLATGSTHSVIAVLVDNGHAPLAPEISDAVEVTIG